MILTPVVFVTLSMRGITDCRVAVRQVMIVGLRPALEGFVVTMHEGACETGSQIPTA